MANVAKTPSAVNKQEESLEHIELIVGNISEAVNMSEESLDSIHENIVDGIVNKLDLHSTKLVAMTNSLMAMSGYMLGHCNISSIYHKFRVKSRSSTIIIRIMLSKINTIIHHFI